MKEQMKRSSFLVVILCFATSLFAQRQQYLDFDRPTFVDGYTRQPNYDAMARAAELRAQQAELQAQRREAARQHFIYYQDLAYKALSKRNKVEFINLSNKALSNGWGWHNSKLYYDRGIAYRDLGNKKQAKKELKKARKKGHPISKKTIKSLLK